MYDYDTITVFHELVGAGSFTLAPAGEKTIVGASVQQSALNSASEVQCDGTTFLKNYGKDFPYNLISLYCPGILSVTKTGQDSASFVISYVPRKLSPVSINAPLVASVSGDINFASASGVALGNTAYMLWFALGIIIFLQAIQVGTYMFKK